MPCWKILKILAVFFVLTGCSTMVKVPDMPDNTAQKALGGWERVLGRYVNARGNVDFHALKENPGDLQRFVHYASITSPKKDPVAFPNDQDKLAFYINSYNSLAMYSILDSGIPKKLGDPQVVGFFKLKKLNISGERMSLYNYENDVIRPLGEERIHFALNCMVRGCPRLPQKPFSGTDLDAELDAAARAFLNEERNVMLDEEREVVYFSDILRFYTEDFLKKEPSLIAYVNRYRTRKIPSHYKIKFIPYDWTVNTPP